jgi:DNA-binding response OmpR family regulator
LAEARKVTVAVEWAWRPVVLVAEDDAELRDALAEALRAGLGARVLVVGTAREAQALLRESPPDLAVLDAGLPGWDGWALARDLKADPDTARIPLLGFSGIGLGGFPLARAAGLDAYVGNGQVDQLLARARELLRRLRSADTAELGPAAG